MEIFSRLSLIVSLIAFGVGALGILAVMTLSVYERLVEIGIRRAFGAPRRKIVLHFLAESALLSLAGGLFGALASLLVVALVSKLAGWGVFIPVKGIALSLALSLGVGVLSGVYPALRAASFEPKDVLRES